MDEYKDISDLPDELSFPIWQKAIIKNNLTYDEAARLAKTFQSLHRLLTSQYNHRELWEHFWQLSYGDRSHLNWHRWLTVHPDRGAEWAASWKSFFFWSLLIERASSRILLEMIVDQAYARHKIEYEEPEVLYSDQGWTGPVALLRVDRRPATLPIRWKYEEGRFSGKTMYTFEYGEAVDSIRTFPVMALIDSTIAQDDYDVTGEPIPIYLLLWIYSIFVSSDLLEAFTGMFPMVEPSLSVAYNALVGDALVARPTDPYFEHIADVTRFPLNPLGKLAELRDLFLLQRVRPMVPFEAPTADGGQIYIGNSASIGNQCIQCKRGDAMMKDPTIDRIFCNVRCQKDYYGSFSPS